ncbi:MAG: hypothetical protein HY924_06650 [Elusimicrobia bacterium]|nr:hypothetical protein [Elusimicrobiota bacterium]
MRAPVRSCLLLLASALSVTPLLAASPAKDSPWRKETVKGLFTATVPAGWTRREFQYVTEPGTAFTDGLSRISAELHGEKTSRYPSETEFLKQMENLGGGLKSAGKVKAAGRECPRFRKRRRLRHREDGEDSTEFIYEEYVLVRVPRGFWLLKFSHASPMYDSKPDGLEAWGRFLATFRPL